MTAQHVVEDRPGWTSPVVARRQLGLELRLLREHAGKSTADVAKALYWSPSKISRYELGRRYESAKAARAAVPAEVDRLLSYFGVTGAQRGSLLELAHAATQTSWWDAYAGDIPEPQRELIGLEHGAASILIWQTSIIPPLLQTEDYARHIVRTGRHVQPVSPQQAARRVDVTMMRQQLLVRESPPQIMVVLDEAALRHLAASRQVMREQLRRLAGLGSGHPAVTVQVLPLTGPLPVFTGGPFTIIGFGSATVDDVLPDVVAIDHFTSSYLIENEQEAHLYRLAFRHLAATALDPAASQGLLKELSEAALPAPAPGESGEFVT
jgi:transcriptional regulator with XRE-family HTH domain